MISIGFLSYTKPNLSLFPAPRIRALLAEAALQKVELVFLDANFYDRAASSILQSAWEDGEWRTGPASLPDLVIFRSPPRTLAQQAVDDWIRSIRPIVADLPIDKLDLHALLESGPLAAHAIPTREIDGRDPAGTLAAFLSTHGPAVVKAADGQRGIGIHFVFQDGAAWIVRKETTSRKGSLAETVRHLVSALQGRLGYRRYLVQKYVPSVARDGRPLDIRVHVQRRADRKWAVTRAYSRLAEAGMPLTNISRGGYQGSLDGALTDRGRPVDELRREVSTLALAVCDLVDTTRPLPLSELGIDLAIDGDGRLWVIEANVFPQTSLHEQEWAAHTIGYAKAVAAEGRP